MTKNLSTATQPDLFSQTHSAHHTPVDFEHQDIPTPSNQTHFQTLIAQNKHALTPMLQQFVEQKESHPDCLLFFRLGDFYELFFDDALIASKALQIALTQRGEFAGELIPMCGVPFHASETYIKKLLSQGLRVAICEQTETPEERKKTPHIKGPLRRNVVRIMTPGTVVEDAFIDGYAHQFLLSVSYKPEKTKHKTPSIITCALFDLSTHTLILEDTHEDHLLDILARYHVVEMLLPQDYLKDHMTELKAYHHCIHPCPKLKYDEHNARQRLLKLYNIDTFDGIADLHAGDFTALNVLMDYINLTQKDALDALPFPHKQRHDAFLVLDHDTRRSLEIDQGSHGTQEGSLFHTLNHTHTRGGARMLHQRFACPLQDIHEINHRLDHIDYFLNDPSHHAPLHHALKNFPDLERAVTRVHVHKGGPRDAKSIQYALLSAQTILKHFDGIEHPFSIPALPHMLLTQLTDALCDEVPYLARDGNFIKDGFSEKLDHYRRLQNQGTDMLHALQERYRKDTGVQTLKIKHNNVMGYFVECPSSRIQDMPADVFVHRQTMANAVRYTTPDLSTLAQDIVAASVHALQIEDEILQTLFQNIRTHAHHLYEIAHCISTLDIALTLAEHSAGHHYTRPILNTSRETHIQGGRHPVVESAFFKKGVSSHTFQSNDTHLNADTFFTLLTGPNMAGKSTYLRQVALITFMAQCGCFVPADHATLGIVDRIFSRIGAGDDLFLGRSTFMVEMVETATILNQATDKSLVILDELGRGTSTYDGVAIARAVSEHILNQIRCRTLFATHYFELTNLADTCKECVNMRMGIKENGGTLLFLHTLEHGCAEKSYGLHVAALSGVPKSVIQRAYAIAESLHTQPNASPSRPLQAPLSQTPLPPHPIISRIEHCDPHHMTPIEALNFLVELKISNCGDA